ncbi:hypothetical protein AGMMS49521_1500 [Campylobacterota bacterium]|nr:hypothetical protein AGMMS49521_1500 [Campylobacterota bacterium]GHV07051.1 hypothetical protein AGMMS50229_13040 [Campylobacterota bacterium]
MVKAYFRREERYEGMQLVYGADESAKQSIITAIDEVKADLGLEPKVMENCDVREPHKCAFYVEFEDDYDREGGAFFEKLLAKLGIKCCE